MKEQLNNVISIVDIIIEKFVEEGFTCLDATVGNGNDTIKLSGKVGESGRVYGFDIQKTAIEITTEKLSKYGYIDRTILINDSHTKLDDYIKEQLDFAIYNLGFLPKGNKEIVTNEKTTIESIKKALNLLKKYGILVVVSYIGHENGLDEYKAVYKYLSLLDQKKFNVLELNFINQINNPPRLFCVEVRGGK